MRSLKEAVKLLDQTLSEEKKTDEMLTKIAGKSGQLPGSSLNLPGLILRRTYAGAAMRCSLFPF